MIDAGFGKCVAITMRPTLFTDNLKKSGAFIPGIRPGDQTARHIDRILSRLTLAGAIYITLVCLLPEFLVLKYNVPFYFASSRGSAAHRARRRASSRRSPARI